MVFANGLRGQEPFLFGRASDGHIPKGNVEFDGSAFGTDQ